MQRREFIQKSILASAATAMSATSYAKIIGANDRVRVGVVGFSDRHRASHVGPFKELSKGMNFEITSLSDIWNRRREEGKAYLDKQLGGNVKVFRNNEEMYDAKAVDAVFMSTADFQHALHTIEAVQAGCDEETLAIGSRVLGPEHKYSLWMMADLAASYGALRRWDEAHRLLETVVKTRRQLDGPANPETLRAMHLLMVSYESAGRQPEVLQLCEESLSTRRKAFGEEHAETLAAKTYLANCYRHAGRLKEAIAIQEPTLESIRRLLPIDHPFRNDALRSLARCYQAAGRDAEKTQLHEELDRIWGGHSSRPSARDTVRKSQPSARTNQFLVPSASNGR